jgi:hypothetical protein
MVAYPEAQKKAQEEIDHVVGDDRMPTLDDLEQMPYMRGLILEVGWLRRLVNIVNDYITASYDRRTDSAPSRLSVYPMQHWH